jgi:hypothetical protein
MSAHPYTLPGCRAPRGLARSSGGRRFTSITLEHCIRRLWTADLACGIAELIVVAYVCHGGTAKRLMCCTTASHQDKL